MIHESALLDDLDVQVFDNSTGWHSILADVTKVNVRRGGDVDGVRIKTDVGMLSISLLNAEDPLEDGILTTGMPIRLVMRSDSAPLFTGTVLDVTATYPLNKSTGEERTIVNVLAVDAVYPMTNTRVGGNAMFYDAETPGGRDISRRVMTLEERVSRLSMRSPVPIAIPQPRAWETVYELPTGSSIDGWSLNKGLPSAVLPSGSSQFVVRGSFTARHVDPEEGKFYFKTHRALSLFWKTTGAATVPKNEYFLQKTITVTPGQLYEFSAGIGSAYEQIEPTDANVRAIILGVDEVSWGGEAKLFHPLDGRYAAPVSFKASSPQVTLKIILSSTATTTVASQMFASIDIFDIRVRRVVSAYPQELAFSMQDATLDQQLDLAANSVASHWYPDKAGTVRIAPPSEYLPVSHTFSDVTGSHVLNYVDVEAAHDTRDLVNFLTIRNQTYSSPFDTDMKAVRDRLRGKVDSSKAAQNTTQQQETDYVWKDEPSIAKYGVRATSIQTNLSLPDASWVANGGILDPLDYGTVAYYDLLDKLTGQRQNPRLIVRKVRWNAQQDIAKAKNLELGQRVVVKYRGFEQDAIIAGIEHSITPSRWLITVTLARP